MTAAEARMHKDREHRLRQRIDQLLDERDHLRGQISLLRHLLTRQRNRTANARAAATLWRLRAIQATIPRARPAAKRARDRSKAA